MSDSEVEEHIQRKYELCRKMGKGAYGIVWKAIDRKSRRVSALKLCFDAFRNSTDAQRTYREIMYLRKLSGHDNIINMQHIIEADNGRDIYITFEFMETDLYTVIRANILQDIHLKFIIYQLLKALKFIHSADLIHRDIKPSNLLLNADCHVKLCDFGLCRSVAEIEIPGRMLTDYVATRWYRSPEILLGSTKYTKGVDMWAVGCILGEMICSRPILPGNSTMNQVEKIMQLTGIPSQEDLESTRSPFAATMIEGVGEIEPSSLTKLCNNQACNSSLDFMDLCLRFNPQKRCSADYALHHPYVADFHNSENEPLYPHGSIKIDISDNKKLTAAKYKERLHEFLIDRNREMMRQANQTTCKGAMSSILTPCG